MNSAVIDLSHWNTIPKDLTEAAAYGVWGVIHKLSESSNYTDPKAAARYSLTRSAGLLWGVYHFIRPGNIDRQVDYFCEAGKYLGIIDNETLIAVDYEDPKVSIEDLIRFIGGVEEELDRSCVLYSGHVLKDMLKGQVNIYLAPCRLWLAQYGSTPVLPPGWMTYWLWQWTDQGNVPGIDPPVDCNDYIGDRTQLQYEWCGRVKAPLPSPEPIEEQVVKVIAPQGIRVEVEYR